MKKIILLFVLGFAFQACQKDVQDNSPAFQARVNNTFWKATIKSATIGDSGDLTLLGKSTLGDIVLKTTTSAKGTYVFGTTNQANKASCVLNADRSKNFGTTINTNPVNLLQLSGGGSGYATTDLVETTTSGTGTGLKVGITANASGGIVKVDIKAAGNGYKAGDVITISGGNNNAVAFVKNVANSNGEITITKNDGMTISGNFKFTAFDPVSRQTVFCRDGFFYEVPLY